MPAAALTADPEDAELDRTFAALAHPARRAILTRLAAGAATVTELGDPLAMSQPAVSKHLKVLEGAGLIRRGRDAQWRPCELRGEPLGRAERWLDAFRDSWEQRLDRLDAYLARTRTAGPGAPQDRAPQDRSAQTRSAQTRSAQTRSTPEGQARPGPKEGPRGRTR